MYHAQFPRPEARFNPNWPGYTWVDLVFPAFLFAMGAAFPFALSGRLAKGDALWRILLGIGQRGLLLLFFAIYAQHITPYQISNPPTMATWWLGLLGFALLFPVYTRLPRDWPARLQLGIRVGGWLAAGGLLLYLNWPRFVEASAESFSLWRCFEVVVGRSDIILLVLTNMAVVGSVIWLVSRGSWWIQVPALAIGLMGHLSRYPDLFPWIDAIDGSIAPWAYRFAFLKYLLIVIPGMMVGDAMLRWMKGPGGAPGETERPALAALAFGAFVLLVLVHAGLQARVPSLVFVTVAACAAVAWPLLGLLKSGAGRLVHTLATWGTGWLLLGVLLDTGWLDGLAPVTGFELSEGGIKKDSSTLSYYFVSTGLSMYLLLSLTVAIDVAGWRRWFSLLIANGQNPMIAYVGIRNLLAPAVNLTGLDAYFFNQVFSSGWGRFVWSLAKTVLLGLAVAGLTRLRVIWRS